MTDTAQRTRFPQNIEVAKVGGLDFIDMVSGHAVRCTPLPVSFTTPSAGRQNICFAVAEQFNGILHINMRSGANNIQMVVSVSAKRHTGGVMKNGVQLLSLLNTNPTNMNLVRLDLYQNGVDQRVALVGVFDFNTTYSFDVDVAATGSAITFPVGNLVTSEFDSRQTGVRFFDTREVVVSNPISGSSNPKDLNSELVSAVITCTSSNVASVASRPEGTTGIGTCFVQSASDGSLVTQMWIDTTDNVPWFRHTLNNGGLWAPWNMVYSRSNTQEIMNAVNAQALVWAIVMG